jgi:hypothetical protein
LREQCIDQQLSGIYTAVIAFPEALLPVVIVKRERISLGDKKIAASWPDETAVFSNNKQVC